MGATLARELGLSVGDSVDLFSPRFIPNPLATKPTFKSFRVVAIVRVGSAEIDDSLVVISKRDARALLRVRSEQTALQLRSTDALGADALAYEIRSLLGSSVQVDTWTTTLGAIYRNIQFSRSIISLMLWLLVAIAAFNLVVSLVMIVREKRSDIGILMTLGAQPRTVLVIFLWQGLAIGLLGILIGSGLGLLGAYYVSDLVVAIESLSGAALLNPEIYPIDFLPSQILLSDVISIACGVSILSLAASLYPARQASRLRPALAIRAD
jgi:lipoprotein-releasing system permease protein